MEDNSLKKEINEILNEIKDGYENGKMLYSISQEDFSQVFLKQAEEVLKDCFPNTVELKIILRLLKPLTWDLCLAEDYKKDVTSGNYQPKSTIIILTKLVRKYGFSPDSLDKYEEITKPCWKKSYWIFVIGTLVGFTLIAPAIKISVVEWAILSIALVLVEIISIVGVHLILEEQTRNRILTNL